MKLRVLAKMVAVLVFAFGAITFVSANLKTSKEKPKSFVITYLITRSENGETPVVTGLAVKTVDADGQWKRVVVRRLDDEYPRQVTVSFLDIPPLIDWKLAVSSIRVLPRANLNETEPHVPPIGSRRAPSSFEKIRCWG